MGKISDFERKIRKYDKKIKFGGFFGKPLGTHSKQIKGVKWRLEGVELS